jgi:protoporphyrinogen oxidase
VAIIGAGPAGLTAAWELCRQGLKPTVLEADSIVGGLSRTAEYSGYLFDIGGHRFYTKVGVVEAIWRQLLGDDLLTRPRLSRIYYRGRFFRYPLEPRNALANLGPLEAAKCVLSYLRAKLLPIRPEETFDVWVSNRFGRRLFETFFKSYTEKVWGIPCREIRAEWAAQRIRGLSMRSLLLDALRPPPDGQRSGIRTLINSFEYPREGPGMMWRRMADVVTAAGGSILLNHPVERICWRPGGVTAVETSTGRFECGHMISTMAIRDLLHALDPAPPAPVLRAADDLHYRDFILVVLIVRARALFPDNWIYVHDPSVHVGRIQNYKNWSPDMVPDASMTSLGLEYFASEGDHLWTRTDSELLALATSEIARLGLAETAQVTDGTVLRMKKAYPVYDEGYESALTIIREFLRQLPNLQLAGRNGMHRYNNQDHSMLTALLAARNVLGANHNLWEVNADAEYLEEGAALNSEDLRLLAETEPAVPRRVARTG